MSEGTMQRAAQREDRAPRTPRGGRPHRALVCAMAVPVMLLAAACSSSDSGSGGDAGKTTAADVNGSASASAGPSPTVQAAAYGKLPQACKVLSDKTLGELVPKGAKSGKESASSDLSTRAGCAWNSLDNNGVKGSQFRWLNVSLLRFESDVTRGSGEKQAQEFYQRQVQDAQHAEDARNVKSGPAAGTGDEATLVRYDLKKKEGDFKQQTVVARVENVVVTLDYNGAGLAGDRTPDADGLAKAAEKAAKETVTAVAAANGASGGTAPSTSSSSSPSSSSSSSSASGSPAKPSSPSKSASPSASASNG
ncbi:DUF3558 family protein [Streptomyces sp. NPDC006700]|uniref:DUF3558 family protein n=1 Tax=unclassified Streptomyces TaxID=2593676 RepID=UPI0033D2976C